MKTATDLNDRGAYIVAFTDIEGVKAVAKSVIDMPTLPEDEQTVCYLVAMQKWVATYCETRGLNPDSPRNLNKVTITK